MDQHHPEVRNSLQHLGFHRSIKAEKPALLKPEEPTYLDINQQAADLAALTPEEFRRLAFLHRSYRTKCQISRDQQKAMASIQQHIAKTAGSYYGAIEGHRNVATELTILKARVEPTDWAHEQDFLESYHNVLKGRDLAGLGLKTG
ncbi:hypothetical protein AUP68_08479 [Ilyonectria robusta]